MGLDDALAQLTFRERSTRKLVRFERGSGALVVRIEGAPAPVRQWLGALLRSYRGIVPARDVRPVRPRPRTGGAGPVATGPPPRAGPGSAPGRTRWAGW